jgi:hypothetical protein
MAGKGRKVKFHGAFKSKAAAKRRERAGSGRYIEEVTVRGHKRYVVISRRSK